MFIEISQHEGVLSPYLEPLAESYRLNLNVVRKVFFGKTEAYEKGDGSISESNPYQAIRRNNFYMMESRENEEERKEREEREEREALRKSNVKKITLNKITLEVITSWEGDNPNITLYFTKEGEGEYQRIKRIIDENTSR